MAINEMVSKATTRSAAVGPLTNLTNANIAASAIIEIMMIKK